MISTTSQRIAVGSSVVSRIDALGITLRDFQVTVHELPASLAIKGLLGLDFLRDTRLIIDFREKLVTIS